MAKSENYSFPYTKLAVENSRDRKTTFARSLLLRFYQLSQLNATKRLELTFSTTFPRPEKAISAIGKYRKILITIRDTTDAVYTPQYNAYKSITDLTVG